MDKKKKVAFFDAKPYDKKSFDAVNKNFGYKITYFDTHLNSNSVGLTKGFDVVCIFVNDTIDKPVIEKLLANKIKLIALRCAGYNNIDLKETYGNIHAVRVPAYSPYAVAEHAAALMLSLNRRVHKAYQRVREGNFSINGLLGFDIHGKTAGIIGTGKIGRCFISILKGFGARVLAFDPYPDKAYAKEAGIEYVQLPELFKQSDIISLHCPLTPDTVHLIDNKAISQMKEGAFLINTGRGKLVDTRALIEGLKSAKVGGAGLDVYEEENQYFFEDFSSSLIGDDVLARLLTFPNVIVTSHQGFFTKEALSSIAKTTLGNIKEYYEGGFLKNEVCYKCDKQCRKKKQKRCF